MNRKLFWGIFLGGLLLKLIAAPLFLSHFTGNLFIPFLDASLIQVGSNPWSLSPPENFPYGAILYVLLVWPKALVYFLFGNAALGSGPLGLFLFKLPILLADVALFAIIFRRFPSAPLRLLGFYWLNPIVFFVNYYVGHVDLIPMLFITITCFALFQERYAWAGVFAGCAVASKFHTALVFPLILLYIWRNEFWPKVFAKMAVWLSTSIVTILVGLYWPFHAGRLGYITFGSPEALRIFSWSLSVGEDLKIYTGFAFVLMVLARLMVTNKVTEQGLFFGLGILFNALVLEAIS